MKQLEDEHPATSRASRCWAGSTRRRATRRKAIETYRRALAISPRQIDLRLRMIRLLQANGELDKAIAEYDGLIRAAPNNPQFVFEECEALLQRGDRARALKLRDRARGARRAPTRRCSRASPTSTRASATSERSLKVLQRLAQASSGDPGHLVDLGDRYFQDGNTAARRADVEAHPRRRCSRGRKALAALGDVYLEHDMTTDALAAYKEAVAARAGRTWRSRRRSPRALRARRARYREARALYEEIVAKAKEKGDKVLARECRTRIVTLWGLERMLEAAAAAPLRAAVRAATPPDVEAGRMLAEVAAPPAEAAATPRRRCAG